MAQRNPVVLNLRGINEFMKSAPVERELLRRAQRVAAAAGDGVEAVSNNDHRWVARAWVVVRTREAAAREARSNSTVRALDAGRG